MRILYSTLRVRRAGGTLSGMVPVVRLLADARRGTEAGSPEALRQASLAYQALGLDWHLEALAACLAIDADGTARTTRAYTRLRPNPDGRRLTRFLVRDRTFGVEPLPARCAETIAEAPGVPFEIRSRATQGLREIEVAFPRGWSAEDGGALTFSLATDWPAAYLPPRGDTSDRPGNYTLWIPYCVGHAALSVDLGAVEPAAWETGVLFGLLDEPPSPGASLPPLVPPGVIHLHPARRAASLEIEAPLASHTYRLTWLPPYTLPRRDL